MNIFQKMKRDSDLSKINTKEDFLNAYRNTSLLDRVEKGSKGKEYIMIDDNVSEKLKSKLLEWLKDKEFFVELYKEPASKGKSERRDNGDEIVHLFEDYDILSMDSRFIEIAKEHLRDQEVAELYVKRNPICHGDKLIKMNIFGADSSFWTKMSLRDKIFGELYIKSMNPNLPEIAGSWIQKDRAKWAELRAYEQGEKKLKQLSTACFDELHLEYIIEVAKERTLKFFEEETKNLNEHEIVQYGLQEKIETKISEAVEYIKTKAAELLEQRRKEKETQLARNNNNNTEVTKQEEIAALAEKEENIAKINSNINNFEV